jgi:hypothetical protein
VVVTATFFSAAVRVTIALQPAVTRGFRSSAVGVGAAFGFLLTVSGPGDHDTIHDGLLVKSPCIFGWNAGNGGH